MHTASVESLAIGLDHILMSGNKSVLLMDISRQVVCFYINDLPNCLSHSRARMFADDTNLTYASNNIDDISHCLSEWLSANRLTLNQSKTEFMLIGSYQRINTFQSTPSLVINNVPIRQVTHTKSLGIYILMKICLGMFILENCVKKLPQV